MFLVLAVSIISLGLTIYYFSVDNEVISITSSYIVVDKNDVIDAGTLLEFKHKNEHTEYAYSSTNSDVLEFSNGNFLAKAAGKSTIVINTSNRVYAKLTIEVRVCDGSEEYPYHITSQEKLLKIGKDDAYPADANYVLAEDIVLTNLTDEEGNDLGATWAPIEDFSGTFDGAYHTITGMSINDATLGDGYEAGFIGRLQVAVHQEQEEEPEQGGEGNQTMSYTPMTPATNVVVDRVGVVKNLILKDVNINVNKENVNIGTIAGICNGEIHTSTAEGRISFGGSNAIIGGIAGLTNDEYYRTSIERCGYTGGIYTVNAVATTLIGGVVGNNNGGNVSECYYIAGDSSNSVANVNARFGGIVGKNVGGENKANIYDSFFYMKDIATLVQEEEEDIVYTSTASMAGVVYENTTTGEANNIYGNYFGGNDVLSTVAPSKTGHVNLIFNTYLSSEDFANQNLEETKFINTRTQLDETKTWAFSTVWSLGAEYPILNIHSAAGSVYVEVIDVVTDTEITSVAEFLSAISGTGNYESKNFNITAAELDFTGIELGSALYPIPDTLLGVEGDEAGALISENGTVIKNLTINNNEEGADVGLARLLTKNVVVSNITFENVTIKGQEGNFVGVLAGKSAGANISNITVNGVTCQIPGVAFGGIFGLANTVDGHALSNVHTSNVDCETVYFTFAGGIVGYNRANIIGTEANPCTVNVVKLSANYSGGVVGNNVYDYATINYVNVSNMTFSPASTSAIYSGEENISGNADVLVGGIAARNYGAISNAYASSTITAYAGDGYGVFAGGITGTNNGQISKSYVYSTAITVNNNATVVVGGLAGTNYGLITTSFVDANTTLTCDMTVVVAPTEDNSVVYDGLSMAGGLVGYDDVTNYDYSIYRCVSQAKKVQAFYSAGLVALEFGRMVECSCGDDTKSDGGMEIKGFMAGGLCTFVRFGYVKDCYGFCTLETVDTEGDYTGIKSIVGRRVSAAAGIALVVDTDGLVQGCYVYASFDEDAKVTFGSFAKVTSRGNVVGCIYVTGGTKESANGTKITTAGLAGSDEYATFMENIGSADTAIWATNRTYPVISEIDLRSADCVLPSYELE